MLNHNISTAANKLKSFQSVRQAVLSWLHFATSPELDATKSYTPTFKEEIV